MPEYIIASTPQDYEAASAMFREYATWLNIDLSFQHFDEELTELKTMYGYPFGGIILCVEGNEYLGCIALRKFEKETGELKRMYVRPAYQHQGIGTALLQEALALAKTCGYTSVRLDTLSSMTPAMELYKKHGFTETPPYYHNPNTNTVYFQKYL